MKKLYYVHNGHYVEHVGDRESCEKFIRNAKELFGRNDLILCVETGGKYVPVWTLRTRLLPSESRVFNAYTLLKVKMAGLTLRIPLTLHPQFLSLRNDRMEYAFLTLRHT